MEYPIINIYDYITRPNNLLIPSITNAINNDYQSRSMIQQLAWRIPNNNPLIIQDVLEILNDNELAIQEHGEIKQGFLIIGKILTPPNKYYIINVNF